MIIAFIGFLLWSVWIVASAASDVIPNEISLLRSLKRAETNRSILLRRRDEPPIRHRSRCPQQVNGVGERQYLRDSTQRWRQLRKGHKESA